MRAIASNASAIEPSAWPSSQSSAQPPLAPRGGASAAAAASEEIVPGGLGVLGRAHALGPGCGHLEPACVLSPRATPGGISVRLGGKGAKATTKLTPASVQRI